MPVFTYKNPPAWCKLREYSFEAIRAGTECLIDVTSEREFYICISGRLNFETSGATCVLEPGARRDVSSGATVRLRAESDSRYCRARGRWKSISGAGLFTVKNGPLPRHGSPCSYEKITPFDRHFHDLDEYWIMLDGRATVSSEDRLYDVGPGDCVATGMGWHHDVLRCHSDSGIHAIWLESELEGRKRGGLLWEPEHGPVTPALERV